MTTRMRCIGIVILIVGVLPFVTGCSSTGNTTAQISEEPSVSQDPSTIDSSAVPTESDLGNPSAAPSTTAEEQEALGISKEQLETLEVPLTGLLIASSESAIDFPGGDVTVDADLAKYYLYYVANNFYNYQAKEYSQYNDDTFEQFIAFSKDDANDLLNIVFGGRFTSDDLPEYVPAGTDNVCFLDSDAVLIGVGLGNPSMVEYAGPDEIAYQNENGGQVEYSYDYIPVTHGLEMSGRLSVTVEKAENSSGLKITALEIIPDEQETSEAEG